MVIHPDPEVSLISYTPNPFDLAVASARTCYSSKVILPDDISEGHRERIGKSIYKAGHHTPFQHPTFVFGLTNVSRQYVWSFLHSHPYFNSEQTSQRYVHLDKPAIFMPPSITEEQKMIYVNAAKKAWDAYEELTKLLFDQILPLQTGLGKLKGLSEKQINLETEKKAIETARYVIPIGALTQLYHTVSAITLKRYEKMMNACDCPTESRLVVQKMIDLVKEIDPDLFDRIDEEVLEEGQLIENTQNENTYEDTEKYIEEFDKDLGGNFVKLIGYNKDAENIVADSVREVIGKTEDQLSDKDAIELVTHPGKNKYLQYTLNTWMHSPLMRSLNHADYTFKKKLSHTADSQEQRHRTNPATRPYISKMHTKKPDFITPDILKENNKALNLFNETMEMLWDAKNKLIDSGLSPEFSVYIIPNAVSIRYTQSGSYLYFLHKWRLRSCLLAQREIFDRTMEEIKEVQNVHPKLGEHIGPPCKIRDLAGAPYADLEGPCPEGSHWCGITVWRAFPNIKRIF